MHVSPEGRGSEVAGARTARRDNHTNEGAQTWLCHTDITDVTDIFCEHESHEKGEVASFYAELKFQTEFRSTTTTTTKLPRTTG